MSTAQEFDVQSGCLALHGELTIYVANTALQLLTRAYSTGSLARVDLAGVTELDTAGLQILLVARTLRTAKGEPVSLVNQSEAVREVFELAGLGISP